VAPRAARVARNGVSPARAGLSGEINRRTRMLLMVAYSLTQTQTLLCWVN
jgi:hypothetical protein